MKQRPTIIGRYDNEYQNVILRHTLQTQTWDPLPVTLPTGKSDFAVLQLPNSPNIGQAAYISFNEYSDLSLCVGIPMMPNMNSGMTQMNGGSCATKNWRNLFNLVIDGKKVVWRTNAQQHPWLQLDLNQDLYVIKVMIGG